ncbi:hypothetical protein ACOMICROBIO_NCLOACGD_02913 [Vibrio sp. B1ASS3]|uniref:hypothetical protein n=1 Tax=Vibrio sp. B1ASS3 TaxID=2751176 RepID=UPI001ABAD82D|nr:hypothetical protein [Vibrio sp. B1ASS3]CAD7814854.1 hypothetical protein ACOMICROBIO_NCLOACGD_02913 [Vibrio sp. B1ASS3]CAE6923631.1 hypothetical protein ACOMICROBIO_NCLOACGD_02913 [Vibrio sp. B1ASS3]
MLKKMTLIAAATIALYGCGGGSSSGSSSGNKGPQNSFDYPIKNATFAPVETTKLGYAFAVDAQPAGSMIMNFKPISAQDLVDFAEQDPDAAIVAPIINDLINNGITQFYLSTQDIEGKPESEENLYFAGTDGALHEFNDTFLVDHKLISLVMNSSPLFRLEGSTVKEKDPNIDISVNTISIDLSLNGEQVANLLNDFEDHEWVEQLPDNADCKAWWSQQITETGARKTFTVSGQSIEAAYLTEKNTYNLRCEGMDSMEFETSAERWFNPALGLIEQVELLKTEQTQISEEKATLSKIEKA